MCEFKCLSLNTKGLSDRKKRRTVFTWLRQQNNDLVLLQETHSIKNTEKQWKEDWKGKCYFSHGQSNVRGTAKPNLDFTLLKVFDDQNGRLLGVKCEIDSKTYTVVNVYCHNNEKSLLND